TTIPVAYRRLRRRPFRALFSGRLAAFRRELQRVAYDAVIDAQGLYKSAFISRMANGPRHGFDAASSREALANLVYHHRYRVPGDGHAIQRVRELFASALRYPVPEGPVDYGLDVSRLPPQPAIPGPYAVFLHGTAWQTKLWPVERW